MDDEAPTRGSAADLQLHYAWADRDYQQLFAISIAMVRPDDGTAIEALRPRRRLPTHLTVSDALDETLRVTDFAWGSVLAQTDSLGQWCIVIEPNGWATSLPETVSRLSAGGVAVNVFWNVSAVMSFSFARLGTLVRTFDPLLYDDHLALAEEHGIVWGAAAPRAGALALMERLTGERIDRAWLLDRARPTYEVPIDRD